MAASFGEKSGDLGKLGSFLGKSLFGGKTGKSRGHAFPYDVKIRLRFIVSNAEIKPCTIISKLDIIFSSLETG